MEFQPQFHAIQRLGFRFNREHINITKLQVDSIPSTVSGQSVIHWRLVACFSVPLGHGMYTRNSLVVDPIRDPKDNRQVTIVAMIKEYAGSTSSVQNQWSAKVVKNLTSNDLVDLMGHWGLNRFFNNESGFGCRTFVQGAIQALETKGYLERGAEESFVTEVETVAETTRHLVPDESGAGWFGSTI